MENKARLTRMLKLESRAQVLASKLAKIELEWGSLRDGDFLESDEYRASCDKRGVVRHYNFGDILA